MTLTQDEEQSIICKTLSTSLPIPYITNKEIEVGKHYIYHDILNTKNRIVLCINVDDSNSCFVRCLSNGDVIHIPYCQKYSYITDTLVPISIS